MYCNDVGLCCKCQLSKLLVFVVDAILFVAYIKFCRYVFVVVACCSSDVVVYERMTVYPYSHKTCEFTEKEQP